MEFDQFLIGFEGFKLGEYDFRFLVDNTFFRSLEYSEIQEGRVVVDAVFIKSERLMEMDLDFKGEVIVPTLTFIAPINAVMYCNASPVFMDADKFHNVYKQHLNL